MNIVSKTTPMFETLLANELMNYNKIIEYYDKISLINVTSHMFDNYCIVRITCAFHFFTINVNGNKCEFIMPIYPYHSDDYRPTRMSGCLTRHYLLANLLFIKEVDIFDELTRQHPYEKNIKLYVAYPVSDVEKLFINKSDSYYMNTNEKKPTTIFDVDLTKKNISAIIKKSYKNNTILFPQMKQLLYGIIKNAPHELVNLIIDYIDYTIL